MRIQNEGKKLILFPFKIQVFHLSGMRLPAKFLIEKLHRKNQKVDFIWMAHKTGEHSNTTSKTSTVTATLLWIHFRPSLLIRPLKLQTPMIDQADIYTLLDEHIGGTIAISLRWPIYIANNDSLELRGEKPFNSFSFTTFVRIKTIFLLIWTEN